MYCENCGCKNEVDARFCYNCSQELREKTVVSPVQPISFDTVDVKDDEAKRKIGKLIALIITIIIVLVVFVTCIYPFVVSRNFKTALESGDGTKAMEIYDEYYLHRKKGIFHLGITADKVIRTLSVYSAGVANDIYATEDFYFESDNYWEELINYLENKTGTVFISDDGNSLSKYYFVKLDRLDFYETESIGLEFSNDSRSDASKMYTESFTDEELQTYYFIESIFESIYSKYYYFNSEYIFNNADSGFDLISASMDLMSVNERDCLKEAADELSEKIEKIHDIIGVYYSPDDYYAVQLNPDRTCVWVQGGLLLHFYGTYYYDGEAYILDVKGNGNYLDTTFTVTKDGDDIMVNGGVVHNIKFTKYES